MFFLNWALITEILTDIFYQCNIKKRCYFSYDNVIISDLWTWSILPHPPFNATYFDIFNVYFMLGSVKLGLVVPYRLKTPQGWSPVRFLKNFTMYFHSVSFLLIFCPFRVSFIFLFLNHFHYRESCLF